MTTTALDQNLEESQGQVRKAKVNPLYRLRSAGIFQKLLIGIPILLWTAAILVGLAFFATQEPAFGSAALGLALAAAALSILMAVFIRDS